MKSIFLAVALTAASSTCFAWDPVYEYQRNCVSKTGAFFTEKQCADMKREADDEEQSRQRQEQYRKDAEFVEAQRREEEASRQAADEERRKREQREFAENEAKKLSENNVCDFSITANGKPSYKTAPCPKGEFMASCSKEIINEKGWTRFETIPCPPGQRKTIQQIEREEQAALKRQCGKDYMTLRVGMKIKRLEQCLGAIYETETVTAKGRIVTYRTTFDWVYVQNGIVTGYTERTDN